MDKELLKSLNNLSEALQQIADILDKKSDKQKSAVTAALESTANIDKRLKSIDEGVKKVIEDNKQILKNQKTILELSKKKERGPSSVEKTGDKDFGDKIGEGLKVILAIAAGILALGFAFKLIGKVNVLTVLAISIALPLLAIAFKKIGEDFTPEKTENATIAVMGMAVSTLFFGLAMSLLPRIDFLSVLGAAIALPIVALAFKFVKDISIDPKKILMMGLSIVAMSVVIVMASHILAFVRPITLPKLVTVVAISTTFAALSYSISNMTEGLWGVTPSDVIMLPFILLTLSVAITAASHILQYVVPITFAKLLTAIAISATFAILAVSVGYLLKSMENADPSALASLPLIAVALIAFIGSVVLASHMMQFIEPISISQFLTSVAIAVTFVVLAYAAKPLISKLKDIDLDDVLKTGLIMLAMTAAVAGASVLINKYMEIVDTNLLWSFFLTSLAVSGASLAVGLTIFALNKLGDLKSVVMGSVSILIIAGTIALASQILSFGNYEAESYPSFDWSMGVGTSLFAFGLSALGLGFAITSTAGIGAIAIALGLVSIAAIAGTMVGVSHILTNGKWGIFPSLDWSRSVAISLAAFGIGSMTLGGLILGSLGLGGLALSKGNEAILTIADTIVEAAARLNRGDFSGGPTPEWAEGVSMSLGAFAPIYLMLMNQGIMDALFGGGVSPEDFKNAILTVCDGIITAANRFSESKGVFMNGPPLEWSRGVAASLGAFGDIFGMLSANKSWFSSGLSMEEMTNGITMITSAIITSAAIFNMAGGVFDVSKVPSEAWSRNVSSSIQAFMPILDYAGGFWDDQSEFIQRVISSVGYGIKEFAWALNGVPFNPIPEGWMANVSDNIMQYVRLAKDLSSMGEIMTGGLFGSIFGIKSLGWIYSDIADGVGKLSQQLENIDVEKLDALRNLTGSIVLLSIMDSAQFTSMMDALESKTEILVDVFNKMTEASSEGINRPTTTPVRVGGGGGGQRSMNDLYNVMSQINMKLDTVVSSSSNISSYINEKRTGDVKIK